MEPWSFSAKLEILEDTRNQVFSLGQNHRPVQITLTRHILHCLERAASCFLLNPLDISSRLPPQRCPKSYNVHIVNSLPCLLYHKFSDSWNSTQVDIAMKSLFTGASAYAAHATQFSRITLLLSLNQILWSSLALSFDIPGVNLIKSLSIDAPKNIVLHAQISYDQERDSEDYFDCTVVIFAPYMIYNFSGFDLNIYRLTPMESVASILSEAITVPPTTSSPTFLNFNDSADSSSAPNNSISIQLSNGEKSIPINIDLLGQIYQLSVEHAPSQKILELSLFASKGKSHLRHSTIVMIYPRYSVHNQTNFDLKLCSNVSSVDINLAPLKSTPLYYRVSGQTLTNPSFFVRLTSVSAPASSLSPSSASQSTVRQSSPFSLDHQEALLTIGDGGQPVHLQILRCEPQPGIFMFGIYERKPFNYRFKNDCRHDISIQDRSNGPFIRLNAKTEQVKNRPYQDLSNVPIFTVSLPSSDNSKDYDLCAIGRKSTWDIGLDSVFANLFIDDNSTRVMVFSNEDQPLQRKKLPASTTSANSADEDIIYKRTAQLTLAGFMISLVNDNSIEFCHIFIGKTRLNVNMFDSMLDCGLEIADFQMDNQRPYARFPCALFINELPNNSDSVVQPTPFLYISFSYHRHDPKVHLDDFYCIHDGFIRMKPVILRLDSSFVMEWLLFCTPVSFPISMNYSLPLSQYKLLPFPIDFRDLSVFQLRQFRLDPTSIQLTWISGLFPLKSRDNQSTMIPWLMMQILKYPLLNVEDVKLDFDALDLQSMTIGSTGLNRHLTDHLKNQIQRQFPKLLAGSNLLGNPNMFIGSVTTGAREFISQSAKGYAENPQQFLFGLASGTGSFLKYSTIGLATSVSRLTGTLGKTLAITTADKTLIRNIELGRENETFSSLESMIQGIARGLTGVWQNPYQGLLDGGLYGMTKGVGQGLFDLLVKPVAGTFGMAHHLSEDIRTRLITPDDPKRKCLPRWIPSEGGLIPYNKEKADLSSLFYNLCRAFAEIEERFVDAFQLSQFDPQNGPLSPLFDNLSNITLFISDKRLLVASPLLKQNGIFYQKILESESPNDQENRWEIITHILLIPEYNLCIERAGKESTSLKLSYDNYEQEQCVETLVFKNSRDFECAQHLLEQYIS